MDINTLHISNSNGKKIINSEYEIIRKVGEGQFGKVMLSKKKNGEMIAIKTINRIDKTKLITKTYLSHTIKIKREIQIMKECDHPNVVKLYQVIDDLKYDKILLVIEYCSLGEIDWKLYNHYNEKNKTQGLTLNKILRDVSNGLEYLHEYKGIIHRDLKPSNLLISQDKTIKISDFGVSLILENNANDSKELGKTMGTPAFYAPELCQFVNNRLSMINDNERKIKIDKRIDIWSLGVILYCLIFNDLPFNGKNEFSLFKNIVNKDVKFPKLNLKIEGKDLQEFKLLQNLIIKILNKDPNKRYSLQEIKNHDFTTFDLTLKESIIFKNFNNNFIDKQLDFSNKIKKFFGGKPFSSIAPVKVSVTDPQQLVDLEPVDDLLESYFDDSSDYEDHEEEVEVIDNITINDHFIQPNNMVYSSSNGVSRSSFDLKTPDKPTFSRHGSFSKLDEIDRSFRPPPLNLSSSPMSVLTSSPISLSSNVTVTIGPNSNSMYSPTRNFFEKIKSMETKSGNQNHTISSLTKNNDNQILEPPSLFRPRQNSFNSPLMRITSSSSSLNLNAYLTDSPESPTTSEPESEVEDKSTNEQNQNQNKIKYPYQVNNNYQDSDDELIALEADSTFVLEPHNKYKDMSDYLDRLD